MLSCEIVCEQNAGVPEDVAVEVHDVGGIIYIDGYLFHSIVHYYCSNVFVHSVIYTSIL